MIVLDSSAAVELLLQSNKGQAVGVRIAMDADNIHVPHLIDLEILSTLRRAVSEGRLAAHRADLALRAWEDSTVTRYAHVAYAQDIWAMGYNLTPYDAAYIALAASLDAPVISCDPKLLSAPGHLARVEVL